MPTYRNRPREIEATQWFPSKHVEGVYRDEDRRPYVVTKQGQKVYISPGEYVVAESDGQHHYPIDCDEFAKLYERVR